MIILALDTTSEFGSLALRSDGRTLLEDTIHSTDGLAHVVFPFIQNALKTAGVRLAEIDCFAAASGPGSFTGVRVGLSAAKGLAYAMSKPAMGVSNLRALSSFGTLPLRAVVTDARRGEVYAAAYGADLEAVMPEVVVPLEKWLQKLDPAVEYEFIVQDGTSVQISDQLSGRPLTYAPRSLAEGVALCAGLDGRRGLWLNPAVLDANYVRRSDAELYWKE